jgi:hypothetical protein
VTGNARALLAERFLGDLDDDVLTGLQHFRNELRTARGTGTASLIAAVVPGATGAGAPFEPRATSDGATAAVGASATTVRAASTIRASTSAIAAAVASAAAERALEARTRIATNPRGVAREIFKGSRRTTDARSASLAREKDYILFDDRCASDGGFTSGSGNYYFFGMLGIGVFVLDVLVFVMLMLMFVQFVRAKFGVVFSMRLGYVGGEFGAVDGAPGFDFGGFFFGEFRDSGDGCFFGLLSTIVCVFFRFFFIEFGAADDGIGYSLRSFFVLGFDESGSERGDLIFV